MRRPDGFHPAKIVGVVGLFFTLIILGFVFLRDNDDNDSSTHGEDGHSVAEALWTAADCTCEKYVCLRYTSELLELPDNVTLHWTDHSTSEEHHRRKLRAEEEHSTGTAAGGHHSTGIAEWDDNCMYVCGVEWACKASSGEVVRVSNEQLLDSDYAHHSPSAADEGGGHGGGHASPASDPDFQYSSYTLTHHAHPHIALTYMFFALTVGSVLYQYQKQLMLPYTVLLLIAGIVWGIIHTATFRHRTDSLFVSTEMWTLIDPHLLLYVFLPALLFGDGMSLNYHNLRKCFPQLLLLAGPGVALGSFLCALMPRYVFDYGWSWEYSMLLGSMCAATDPVAVVGLLKELGASPNLSMIIGGESMLNDGTAVVFFLLFKDLALGKEYTATEIVKFFAQMSLCGPLIGIAIALGGLLIAIKTENSAVEITMFFVMGYCAFIAAEQEGGASGVLGTVFASFVVAKYAWPYVENPHAMHHIWHWVEWTGNTLLFFLTGTILGSVIYLMRNIGAWDWGYLLLNYVWVNVVRFIVVFLFYPILSRTGAGLTWQEAVFMSWGGLRGAVGLALAISILHEERFAFGYGSADGERFLIHVGGIAALTLLINGTTGGWLLLRLGLISPSDAEKKANFQARHTVVELVEHKLEHVRQQAMFKGYDENKIRHMVDLVKTSIYAPVDPDGRLRTEEIGRPKNDAPNPALVATMRKAFLNTLTTEYELMLHHGELPQDIANDLLLSAQRAHDFVDSKLAHWDELYAWREMEHAARVQSMPFRVANGLYHMFRFQFDHKIKKATLSGKTADHLQWVDYTCLCVFVEANKRAATKIFQVVGVTLDTRETPEEIQLEKEINEVIETAQAFQDSGIEMSQSSKTKVVTELMAITLKKEMQEIVERMTGSGVLAPKDGANIVADIVFAVERSDLIEDKLMRKASEARHQSRIFVEDATTLVVDAADVFDKVVDAAADALLGADDKGDQTPGNADQTQGKPSADQMAPLPNVQLQLTNIGEV